MSNPNTSLTNGTAAGSPLIAGRAHQPFKSCGPRAIYLPDMSKAADYITGVSFRDAIELPGIFSCAPALALTHGPRLTTMQPLLLTARTFAWLQKRVHV